MHRAGSHASGLKAGESKGTYIILMNFDVHVCNRVDIQTQCTAKVPDHVHNGKEIFAIVERAISLSSQDFHRNKQLKTMMR